MAMVNDSNIVKRRATTIEIKNCGALIRNIYMEGRDIVAEVETLSGYGGPEIANMILRDKVNIGFSKEVS